MDRGCTSPNLAVREGPGLISLLTASCLSREARGLLWSGVSSNLTLPSVCCVSCLVRGRAPVGPQPGVGVLPSTLLTAPVDPSSWSQLLGLHSGLIQGKEVAKDGWGALAPSVPTAQKVGCCSLPLGAMLPLLYLTQACDSFAPGCGQRVEF